MYKLPHDVYDRWSLTDLNDYVAYIDEKLSRAKNKKGSRRTYTDDEIDKFLMNGG